MNTLQLQVRDAVPGEVEAIAALVNSAYRGETSRAGWTTEADLLGGQRTDADMVRELILEQGSRLCLCVLDDEIIGTAYLRDERGGVYLGMLTVKPGWQGCGIGSRFLAAIEKRVRTEWQASWIRMTVISLREELIAYYERKGYRRTGTCEPFPTSVRYGIPKVDGLELVVLEKRWTDLSG